MSTTDEILSVLRESPLLAALTDRQASQLTSVATVREFADGDKLVTEGTKGAMAMWVILSGEVDILAGGTAVNRLGRGAHIGEMAVLAENDLARSADVVAVGTVRAVRIAKWDVLGFIKANPEVAMRIISELAQRLDHANRARL